MSVGVDEARLRFSNLDWAQHASEHVVTLGGAGGIGSWFALPLARIGYQVRIFDFDRIDTTNLGGQLFRTTDVGKFKVDAVKTNVMMFTSAGTVVALNQRINSRLDTGNIVASCFDNMEARKTVYESWKTGWAIPWLNLPEAQRKATFTPLLIDGRLMAEQLQVFFVTPERLSEYEPYLFADSDVEDMICTNKATSHFAMGIAYQMTRGLNNHVHNQHLGHDDRAVPFLIEDEGFMFTQTITR